MSEKTQTHKVGPLAMRAAVGSIDMEKRTVDVTWTTGAKVLRSSWLNGPFYEELSLDPAHVRLGRLNNGAPFLANHDSYDVARTLGVVESASLNGKEGVARVRFAKAEDDPEADKIFRKIADGIIQNVSVGYRTYKAEKLAPSGNEEIPTLRAVDWEPYEISAVAMGADDGAGFRSAPTNDFTFTVVNQERTMEQPNQTPGAPAPSTDNEAARAAEVRAAADAVRLERERTLGIRTAVRAAKLGESLADKLIEEGVPLDAARKQILDQLAAQSESVRTEQHTPVTGGEDASDKWHRGALSWLLARTAGSLVKQAKAAKVEAFADVDEDAGEFRGMSLFDMARASLERRGVKTKGMDRMTLVGRAFTTRDGGPYAGTGDFPVLLENLMGKILLGSYAVTPDTWSRFCKTDTVPDFRASPRYRTGSFGVLDSLNENGEFKNKAIPDGTKSTIQVGTKGNIIAISRQLVINDDMSALSDLGTKLGRAARLSIEVDVYALLAQNGGLGPTMSDSNPFFHASRGNVNATGAALSVAAIDADRVVMAAQKDPSGNEYLDLRPVTLLIPVGLGGLARVINSSAINPDANGKIQQPNYVQGLFSDIIDTPRLSGTRRYLFAPVEVAPAFVVAFLEGQGQGPVLETEQGWRVDGTEMRVRMDYQAQAFDPKGALTNAGV